MPEKRNRRRRNISRSQKAAHRLLRCKVILTKILFAKSRFLWESFFFLSVFKQFDFFKDLSQFELLSLITI